MPASGRPTTLDAYSQDLINAIVQNYAEPAFHCSVHHVEHPAASSSRSSRSSPRRSRSFSRRGCSFPAQPLLLPLGTFGSVTPAHALAFLSPVRIRSVRHAAVMPESADRYKINALNSYEMDEPRPLCPKNQRQEAHRNMRPNLGIIENAIPGVQFS